MSTELRTLGLNDSWIFFCARRRLGMIFSKNVSSAPFTP
jgi:hypothetical protein